MKNVDRRRLGGGGANGLIGGGGGRSPLTSEEQYVLVTMPVSERSGLLIGFKILESVVLFFCPSLIAASDQPFSPYQSGAEYRNVFEIFAHIRLLCQ